MVRTAVFGAANLGSNPSAPASKSTGQRWYKPLTFCFLGIFWASWDLWLTAASRSPIAKVGKAEVDVLRKGAQLDTGGTGFGSVEAEVSEAV